MKTSTKRLFFDSVSYGKLRLNYSILLYFIQGGDELVKILVVDDDKNIRELVALYLKLEGFEVVEAADGESALQVLEDLIVDLAIVDVMMPKKSGWEVCEELKFAFEHLPIIMLTAKSETMHRIHGLKLGADDYIVKPFDPMELVLRVKAILKRYKIMASQGITLGDVFINRKNNTITCNSQQMLLPLKEFEILFKLASYPEQIFTREQLIEQIWGLDYEGDFRTVDVHIKRLRERLGGVNGSLRITTIRGLGYRLESDK